MEYIELGKIAELVRGPFGGSLKKNIFVNDGIAVYEQQHAIYNQFDQIRYFIDESKFNEMKRFEVKPNDLIMSCSGTMGKVAIVPKGVKKGIINQALLKITPSSKLDSRFLEYYMKSTIFFEFLNADVKGAAIKNVASVKELKKIPVMVISLEEQQTIVAKLDQAFAAIDQAKNNIEKNIANAKELFQSKLNQIFSQKGEGFIEEKLDNVLVKTKNINPKDFPGKTFRYVDVSAVDRNKLEITEFSEITSDYAPSRARKLILENDVIFATVRPTLRRVALINKDFDSQICSTGYVVLRNNKSKLLPKVIYYYLLTTSFLENIEKLQKGASYPAVTDGEVKSQLINYPISLETQQQIVDQLDQLQEQTNLLVTKYQQKLANLEELKKSILEKAFKGELSTAAIEKV